MTPRQVEIRDLHASGQTPSQIAVLLGITYQRVRALHAHLGLTPHRTRAMAVPRPQSRTWAAYQAAVAARVMERGIRVRIVRAMHPDWSVPAVARHLGCAPGTVRADLRAWLRP
jgi:hypothetical protein